MVYPTGTHGDGVRSLLVNLDTSFVPCMRKWWDAWEIWYSCCTSGMSQVTSCRAEQWLNASWSGSSWRPILEMASRHCVMQGAQIYQDNDIQLQASGLVMRTDQLVGASENTMFSMQPPAKSALESEAHDLPFGRSVLLLFMHACKSNRFPSQSWDLKASKCSWMPWTESLWTLQASIVSRFRVIIASSYHHFIHWMKDIEMWCTCSSTFTVRSISNVMIQVRPTQNGALLPLSLLFPKNPLFASKTPALSCQAHDLHQQQYKFIWSCLWA